VPPSRSFLLWLSPKGRVFSPQSGRMIVAQQFTAGDKSARIGSPQSGRLMINIRSSNLFSRPLHGLRLGSDQSQAINRWAIFNRPLKADSVEPTFWAKPLAVHLKVFLRNLLINVSTSVAGVAVFHRSPSQSQLHPVLSDPKAYTSPVCGPDPELRSNSCTCSGEFHHPDRASP
jgi:hypothetical protein